MVYTYAYNICIYTHICIYISNNNSHTCPFLSIRIYIILLDFRIFPNFLGPWTDPLPVYAERAKTLRLREAQMNFSSFFRIKWNITFKYFIGFIVGFILAMSSFTFARNSITHEWGKINNSHVFEEIFSEKRNASTPLGIEPRSFRLPVECSVIWATEVPQLFSENLVNAYSATDVSWTI